MFPFLVPSAFASSSFDLLNLDIVYFLDEEQKLEHLEDILTALFTCCYLMITGRYPSKMEIDEPVGK